MDDDEIESGQSNHHHNHKRTMAVAVQPPTAAPAAVNQQQDTTKGNNNKKNRKKSDHKNADETDLSMMKDLASSRSRAEFAEQHLPPLFLTFIVLWCSGTLLVFAIRDFFTTGRIIAGDWDEAYLSFTKSMDWYDDSKGWKSQMGGFSAVKATTTDANNMGGFFMRKFCGAACLAFQLQKLVPLLVCMSGSKWNYGHYRPLLMVSIVANIALSAFYVVYMEDLSAYDNAENLPKFFCVLLTIESMVMLYYLKSQKRLSSQEKGPAIAMTQGKTPTSVPSRIVSRTVFIVSTLMSVLALRDLFMPGYIFELVPKDDLWLEWTNSLMHSPPPGSVEEADMGLEAPFYIGDKYICQLAALNVLINCMYKFTTACGLIKYQSDGSGLVQAQLIWKMQCIGNALMLWVLRIFAPAAKTASLDLRWHLMCLAYETFILGLYGYF